MCVIIIYNFAFVCYIKKQIDVILREERIPVKGQDKLNKGNICVRKIRFIPFS